MKRNNFWQMVRGLCILAVILIHCPTGIPYGSGSLEFGIWMIIRQFINFPVAIFIFLAGYFTNEEKVLSDIKHYYVYRGGLRLLLPYVIWSIIYSLYSILSAAVAGKEIVWRTVAKNILIGKASPQLYYVLVLLQLVLITPFLLREIKKRSKISHCLWFITPLYLVYVYIYNILKGREPLLYATIFAAWFIFYYLGLNVRLGVVKFPLKKIPDKVVGILLGIGYSISIFEAILLMRITNNPGFAVSQIRLGCFLTNMVLIAAFLKISEKSRWQQRESWLSQIGDLSYGIYYIHYLILMIVVKVLNVIRLDHIWILFALTTFILTAILSCLIIRIMRNVLGRSMIGRIILSGLGIT